MASSDEVTRMDPPLDTIEYLARSDHRVEVLDAIRTAPRTREAVRELTDASRVTVGRIFTDLEERGWIERDGRRYRITAAGRYVSAEFARLVENLETFETLPPVVEWLPPGEPAFDLARLDSARVVTAEEGDLIAPIHRSLALIERADRLRAVANGASREFIEAMGDAVERGATQTIVTSTEAVDAFRSNAGFRDAVRSMLETGRFSLHALEGDLPVVQIADDTVAFCSGDHRAMVETGDGEVRDWAEGYLDSLLADATPISAEHIAADDPPTEGEAVVD